MLAVVFLIQPFAGNTFLLTTKITREQRLLPCAGLFLSFTCIERDTYIQMLNMCLDNIVHVLVGVVDVVPKFLTECDWHADTSEKDTTYVRLAAGIEL